MLELEDVFRKKFGCNPTTHVFSPGRVNLIGEHMDYNGGHVFPISLSIGTKGVASKRTDNKVCLYSTNFPALGVVAFTLTDTMYNPHLQWGNYVLGMLRALANHGFNVPVGFNLAIEGNIPNGAGLSSSASVEMLIGVLLKEMYRYDLSTLDLVTLGQWTENKFIGVNSGIMDQFAIGFGRAEHGLFLNTTTLAYELVPVVLGDYKIVVMNTNKRRELSDSKYNERRAECEQALTQLQTKLPIKNLCALSIEAFEADNTLPLDSVLRKRTRHVISENARTILAKKVLQAGDLLQFGQLLNASHQSLKEDYEVTGLELDTLVACAQAQAGVLGARMTGAGFGGCALALVKETAISTFRARVGKSYEEKIGYAADFYVVDIGNGTSII